MDICFIIDQEPSRKAPTSSEYLVCNGSPSMSCFYSKPPDRSLFVEENGRIYHGYRRGVYMLLCDEKEQDCLDLFYKLFTVARVSASLIYVLYSRNGRFLDVGCGTGIWAIDVVHEYFDVFVVGVDLFYVFFDFESSWILGEDFWDFIYLQMGCSSIISNLAVMIMMRLSLNAWYCDGYERKVVRWYNLVFSESLEMFSLVSFSRVFKWLLDRIRYLAAEAKSEVFNKEFYVYDILYIYQARKPGGRAH
ncbi:hypothetical protein ASPCADRAFT_519194 [Aspergillus carbonarius ITEM 5010]|uniref:Methyltransferase domain-containing protein n=1 Tax=Aspergillus carbonarius (strain ITEM 5010) TaxID=602072 RepID=A0A1R3R7Q0_ASPC5|nr:hypothetical protein ASPCADRAFT_519194 [Aspergillus carbonarius ITEM 5010]